MGTVARLLRKTPSPIRRAVYRLVPFGRRYGTDFPIILSDVLKREKDDWWYRLPCYQTEQLRAVMERAWNTEYYRPIMENAGLEPKHWRIDEPREALARLPVTTKADVLHQGHRMRLPTLRPDRLHTSGSTGQRLTIYTDKIAYEQENAFQERAFRSHGGSLMFGRSVWIKRYIPSQGQPLYHDDHERQWRMISPYHIGADTVRQYVKWINETRAPTLVGYPSSIYILAREMLDAGLDGKLTSVKAVHVASEYMPKEWETAIYDATWCMPRDHYGMMERGAFFHRCWCGIGYHESTDYGYTEIGDDGRVLVTGFINPAMPLLRYDVGDVAEPMEIAECICGSALPLTVKRFYGRRDDLLMAHNGHLIPPVNFYTVMHRYEYVDMFRLTQHSRTEVELEVKPVRWPTETEKRDWALELAGELQKRFGGYSNGYDVKFVGEIPRSEKTGKIRCIRNMMRV